MEVLGVQLSDVFRALQASLGGFYVNDLNLFGRRWQVNVQAEGGDSARPKERPEKIQADSTVDSRQIRPPAAAE